MTDALREKLEKLTRDWQRCAQDMWEDNNREVGVGNAYDDCADDLLLFLKEER